MAKCISELDYTILFASNTINMPWVGLCCKEWMSWLSLWMEYQKNNNQRPHRGDGVYRSGNSKTTPLALTRPTPAGSVRGQYWPPKDQPGTRIFCCTSGYSCPRFCHDRASFLHQQSTRTQIALRAALRCVQDFSPIQWWLQSLFNFFFQLHIYVTGASPGFRRRSFSQKSRIFTVNLKNYFLCTGFSRSISRFFSPKMDSWKSNGTSPWMVMSVVNILGNFCIQTLESYYSVVQCVQSTSGQHTIIPRFYPTWSPCCAS
jgi:hypothetical protein